MDSRTKGWGDDDDEVDLADLPETSVKVDEKGIKTVVSYREVDGERQKVTQRIRVVVKRKKVPRSIKDRREWAKFGVSAGCPPGPEEETTIVSRDDIYIENPGDEAKAAKREEEEVMKRLRAGAMRRKFNQQMEEKKAGIASQVGLDTAPKMGGLRTGTALSKMADASGVAPAAPGGKYIPMHMREGGGGGGGSRFGDDSEQNTLRVTNISEDTNEDDLRDLFSQFGKVQRVYLAKDRETQQSRGFAYISYHDREPAERAMVKLNGYGYDHLILKVEWAKPSSKDDVGSQSVMQKGIVSGYGGALPQGLGK